MPELKINEVISCCKQACFHSHFNWPFNVCKDDNPLGVDILLHDKLNLSATARASLGVYNTKSDIDKLNESLNKCKKIFNL